MAGITTREVNVKINLNMNQANAQIEKLNSQLSSIATKPITVNYESLTKASQAAKDLQQNLAEAYNTANGKFDLSAFNQSMQQSGRTIQSYRQALVGAGEEGTEAFTQLATTIATADKPVARISSSLAKFGNTLKNTINWQLSSSMIHGAMSTYSQAISYAKQLNKSLTDIRIVTGQSIDDMAKFAVQANKAAKSLSATTTQYTNASLIYYQQGLGEKAVKERTEVTLKLANAAGISAEKASQQLTSIWNNFAKGSDNLERYADVLVKLGSETASSSEEISKGMQKFAAVSNTVGLSYEYAASALATVTATTRESADTVGTAFRTLFSRLEGLKLGERLEDGTDLNKYSKALDTVGVNIKKTNGEMKTMDAILDELGVKWQQLGKDQQIALAQTIGGARQYSTFMALMDNWDFFQQNVNRANNASGALEKQQEIYASSWEGASKRVKASMEDIFDSVINDQFMIKLTNLFSDILDGLGGVIDGFGGLGGIMATVSGIFMTKYAKEMPRAINDLGYNMKAVFRPDKIINENEALQLQTQAEVNKLRDSAKTEAERTKYDTISQLTDMNISYQANAYRMSTQERKAYQLKMQNAQLYGQNLQAEAEKYDQFKTTTKSELDATSKGDLDQVRADRKILSTNIDELDAKYETDRQAITNKYSEALKNSKKGERAAIQRQMNEEKAALAVRYNEEKIKLQTDKDAALNREAARQRLIDNAGLTAEQRKILTAELPTKMSETSQKAWIDVNNQAIYGGLQKLTAQKGNVIGATESFIGKLYSGAFGGSDKKAAAASLKAELQAMQNIFKDVTFKDANGQPIINPIDQMLQDLDSEKIDEILVKAQGLGDELNKALYGEGGDSVTDNENTIVGSINKQINDARKDIKEATGNDPEDLATTLTDEGIAGSKFDIAKQLFNVFTGKAGEHIGGLVESGSKLFGAGSAAFGTGVASNQAWNIINDNTVGAMEKISAVGGALSSMTATAGITTDAVSAMGGALGAFGGTLGSLGGSLAAFAPIAGPIVAILSGAIGIFGPKLIQMFDDLHESVEETQERLSKEAEKTKTIVDNLAVSQDEMNANFDTYTDLLSVVNGSSKTSQEYLKNLNNLNEEANSLIKKYNLSYGQDYTYGDNGQIILRSGLRESLNRQYNSVIRDFSIGESVLKVEDTIYSDLVKQGIITEGGTVTDIKTALRNQYYEDSVSILNDIFTSTVAGQDTLTGAPYAIQQYFSQLEQLYPQLAGIGEIVENLTNNTDNNTVYDGLWNIFNSDAPEDDYNKKVLSLYLAGVTNGKFDNVQLSTPNNTDEIISINAIKNLQEDHGKELERLRPYTDLLSGVYNDEISDITTRIFGTDIISENRGYTASYMQNQLLADIQSNSNRVKEINKLLAENSENIKIAEALTKRAENYDSALSDYELLVKDSDKEVTPSNYRYDLKTVQQGLASPEFYNYMASQGYLGDYDNIEEVRTDAWNSQTWYNTDEMPTLIQEYENAKSYLEQYETQIDQVRLNHSDALSQIEQQQAALEAVQLPDSFTQYIIDAFNNTSDKKGFFETLWNTQDDNDDYARAFWNLVSLPDEAITAPGDGLLRGRPLYSFEDNLYPYGYSDLIYENIRENITGLDVSSQEKLDALISDTEVVMQAELDTLGYDADEIARQRAIVEKGDPRLNSDYIVSQYNALNKMYGEDGKPFENAVANIMTNNLGFGALQYSAMLTTPWLVMQNNKNTVDIPTTYTDEEIQTLENERNSLQQQILDDKAALGITDDNPNGTFLDTTKIDLASIAQMVKNEKWFTNFDFDDVIESGGKLNTQDYVRSLNGMFNSIAVKNDGYLSPTERIAAARLSRQVDPTAFFENIEKVKTETEETYKNKSLDELERELGSILLETVKDTTENYDALSDDGKREAIITSLAAQAVGKEYEQRLSDEAKIIENTKAYKLLGGNPETVTPKMLTETLKALTNEKTGKIDEDNLAVLADIGGMLATEYYNLNTVFRRLDISGEELGFDQLYDTLASNNITSAVAEDIYTGVQRFTEQYGDIAGKQLALSLVNEENINTELAKALSEISFGNSKLEGLFNLKDKINITDNAALKADLEEAYKIAFDTMGTSGVFKELLGLDEFTPILQTIENIFKDTGKITAQNIQELASQSESLSRSLKEGSVEAGGLAKAFEMAQKSGLILNQISENFLQALNKAESASTHLSNAIKHSSEFEMPDSAAEIPNNYAKIQKQMEAAWKEGLVADPTVYAGMQNIFGNTKADYGKRDENGNVVLESFIEAYTRNWSDWQSENREGGQLTANQMWTNFYNTFGAENRLMSDLASGMGMQAYAKYFKDRGFLDKTDDNGNPLIPGMTVDKKGNLDLDASMYETQDDFIQAMKDAGIDASIAEDFTSYIRAGNVAQDQAWKENEAKIGFDILSSGELSGKTINATELENFYNNYGAFLDDFNNIGEFLDYFRNEKAILVDFNEHSFDNLSNFIEAIQKGIDTKAEGYQAGREYEQILDKSERSRGKSAEDYGLTAEQMQEAGYVTENGQGKADTVVRDLNGTKKELMSLGATESQALDLMNQMSQAGTVFATTWTDAAGDVHKEIKDTNQSIEDFETEVERAAENDALEQQANLMGTAFAKALTNIELGFDDSAEAAQRLSESIQTFATSIQSPTITVNFDFSAGLQSLQTQLNNIVVTATAAVNEAEGKVAALEARAAAIGGSTAANGGYVSSYASGSVNNKLYPGVALTGEEGPEIIWNKEHHYAYVTGKKHPQFQNLRSGDRVFNAQETKQILHDNTPIEDMALGLAKGGVVGSFSTWLPQGYDRKGANIPSGGGDSGGGGSDWQPERYHEILEVLEDIANDVEHLDKITDRSFGKGKLELLDSAIELLDEDIKAQQDYISEINQWLEHDTNELKDLGVTFYDDGRISNYDELQEKYAKAAADGDKEAEKQWKKIQQYEETLNLLEQEEDALYDKQIAKLDKQLERISTELEINIRVNDADLNYLDYLLGKIDDDAYDAAEGLSILGHQMDINLTKAGNQNKALYEYLNTIKKNENDDISDLIAKIFNGQSLTEEDLSRITVDSAAMEKILSLQEEALNMAEVLEDLRKSMVEMAEKHFKKFSDKVKDQSDVLSSYNKTLKNYTEIINLLGVKFNGPSAEILDRLRKDMTANATATLKAAKAAKAVIEEEYNSYKQLYEEAQTAGDTEMADKWSKQMDETYRELQKKNEEFSSTWLQANQVYLDAYKSAAQQAISAFESTVSPIYGDLSSLREAYDRYEKVNSEYLQDYEKLYQLRRLSRDIDLSISDTDNLNTKKELLKYQEMINQKVASGVRMSEYEVAAIEHQLELEKARLALDEAKNAKSYVTLSRDQNGNWGYVYTAEEDKVASAEQQYEDKLHAYQEYNQNYIKTLEQMILEANENMTQQLQALDPTDKAYAQKQQSIVSAWEEQLRFIREQFNTVTENQANTYELATDAYNVNNLQLIDTFGELGISFVTGINNIDDYINTVLQGIPGLLNSLGQAESDFAQNILEAEQTVGEGTSMGDIISSDTKNIEQQTENAIIAIDSIGEQMRTEWDGVQDAINTICVNYLARIQQMITGTENLYQSISALHHELSDTWNDNSDPSLRYNKYNFNYIKREHKGSDIDKLISASNSPPWKGFRFKDDFIAFKGYNGYLENSGKVSSSNIKDKYTTQMEDSLKQTEIRFDNILKTLDVTAQTYQDNLVNLTNYRGVGLFEDVIHGGVQQSIIIEANFPDAVNHNEIQEAFNNLINEAAQYANRK